MNDLQERTHLLRTDLSPMFERLRLLFSERGVDPKAAQLAQLFSDDNSLQYGIVVAPNGQVFEFDYVWEVYKPEQQRRFGYYTLPVLWGDRLVARFDSKLDRTTNTFIILGLWLEDEALGTDEAFAEALARGFARFVRFLGASKLDAQAIREPLLRRRACASQEAHSSEG